MPVIPFFMYLTYDLPDYLNNYIEFSFIIIVFAFCLYLNFCLYSIFLMEKLDVVFRSVNITVKMFIEKCLINSEVYYKKHIKSNQTVCDSRNIPKVFNKHYK